MVNNILAKHCGRDIASIYLDTERDKFMVSEDAKEYGIIDDILTSRKGCRK